MDLRSPLARARGLGSAKHGTQHFWLQRISAIVLVPLCFWFVTSMVAMVSVDYETVSVWLSTPLTAVLMILFIIALFYHAQLGLQVVIEDYVESEWQKLINIILVKVVAFIGGLASIFAVMTVFLAA